MQSSVTDESDAESHDIKVRGLGSFKAIMYESQHTLQNMEPWLPKRDDVMLDYEHESLELMWN